MKKYDYRVRALVLASLGALGTSAITSASLGNLQLGKTRPSDGGVIWKKGDFYKKREPAKKYELTSEIIMIIGGGQGSWDPTEAPRTQSSLHLAKMILWPESRNSFSKQDTATPAISLRLNADFATTETKGGTKYQYLSHYTLELKADISGFYAKGSEDVVDDVRDVLPVNEPEPVLPKVEEPENRTVTPDIKILANISSDIWFENGVEDVSDYAESITIMRSAPVNMRILFDVENQFIPDYSAEQNEDEELLTMFAMVLQKMDEY